MSKNNFHLDHWFLTDKNKRTLHEQIQSRAKSPAEILAPFYPAQNDQPNKLVQNYFVPGWNGDSLISNHVKNFRKLLLDLSAEAEKSIRKNSSFPKKTIQLFYEEFLSFSDFMAVNATDLDDSSKFWAELQNDKSEYKKNLDHFCKIFSYRIAVIFLLKARFVITIQEKQNRRINLKDIIYPVSALNKIFRSASSTELKSTAFEQNIFSWFKPSDCFESRLEEFTRYSTHLSITDIIKTISMGTESILKSNAEYSHSISHRQFGLFLNNLLINFPIWLDSIKKKSSKKYRTLNKLEIISCKFKGDHLESLSLSHWLGQDANKHEKWEQVLCPDFKQESFVSGQYLNIVNELQFLTFLAEISHEQGSDPDQFICNIVNAHISNRKVTKDQQKLFSNIEQPAELLTYDRVVLNLTHYPKNNPHHFVFNQLHKEVEELKDEGFVYLLTSKNLFIPSQKAKVETLLQSLKLEGVFNFEELKGKGEVGTYLYIFSKRNSVLKSIDIELKNTCYNFRFGAELNTFQDFKCLTQLIQDFYLNNFKDVPPLYQKQLKDSRLEFYQDAIANGQLIHSSSKDTKNITHPFFFERLVKTSHPMSYFYDLQEINFLESEVMEEDTLFNFSQSFRKEKSPFCLIVDKRERHNIKIEIIATEALEATSYEYGHVLCTYFYFYPKWNGLSYETLAAYLESSIGMQITQLTFSNEMRKTKGNLSKLLIPSFFNKNKKLPEPIQKSLLFLQSASSELLTIHPSELEKRYQETVQFLKQCAQEYPSNVLTILTVFNKSVLKCLDLIGHTRKREKVNFSNPLFKTPLVLSKKYSIYPDNSDVYIEFNSNHTDDIHHPLSKTKIVSTETGLKLEIYSEECLLISLYSEKNMLTFIDFILSNLKGHAVSKIIQGVQVPTLVDLNNIFDSYQSQVRAFNSLSKKLLEDFDQVLSTTIFSGK